MAASFQQVVHRVGAVAEENANLQRVLYTTWLDTVSTDGHRRTYRLTSTSCRMAITKISYSEFRHPMRTPALGLRGASDGQNTRINPLPVPISTYSSKRPSSLELFSRRYAAAAQSRVQACLTSRYAFHGDDQEDEEDGQHRKPFCRTCPNSVVPGKYCKLIQLSNEVPACRDISCGEDRSREDGKRVH